MRSVINVIFLPFQWNLLNQITQNINLYNDFDTGMYLWYCIIYALPHNINI